MNYAAAAFLLFNFIFTGQGKAREASVECRRLFASVPVQGALVGRATLIKSAIRPGVNVSLVMDSKSYSEISNRYLDIYRQNKRGFNRKVRIPARSEFAWYRLNVSISEFLSAVLPKKIGWGEILLNYVFEIALPPYSMGLTDAARQNNKIVQDNRKLLGFSASDIPKLLSVELVQANRKVPPMGGYDFLTVKDLDGQVTTYVTPF